MSLGEMTTDSMVGNTSGPDPCPAGVREVVGVPGCVGCVEGVGDAVGPGTVGEGTVAVSMMAAGRADPSAARPGLCETQPAATSASTIPTSATAGRFIGCAVPDVSWRRS
jgi:hypothetical protein